MSAKTIMIQGTGSHVGKSFIVAGLCRLFKDEGVSVAPFKSQNMALNSFATEDGLEMGRAQATQAMAAGIKPSVLFNPILLKPTSDRRAQVVVLGKPLADMDARAYHARKTDMLAVAKDALETLRRHYELVIIEGAGSPAEINLADRDIVNMTVARLADAPVILVVDIDKGGAFAAIVGTLELLPPIDRARVAGFIINKFRGDIGLLKPGLDWLEERTGRPVLGVVPQIDVMLEDEDSVGLDSRPRSNGPAESPGLRLAVPWFPRIANFTDFQPFELTDGVRVDFVRSPGELGNPDAVIIPGTKNTLIDLAWLRTTGLADAVVRLARSGTPVIGVCGGFQMLGRAICDPTGIESTAGAEARGLDLLPVATTLTGDKTVKQVEGTIIGGEHIMGGAATDDAFCAYEIHAGVSIPDGPGRPFSLTVTGAEDGWVSADLPVLGTYMHGLFDNPGIRRSFLNALAAKRGLEAPPADGDDFDTRIRLVSEALARSLDLDGLRLVIGLKTPETEETGVC